MTKIRYKNYVNGEFVANESGEFFPVVNPANAEQIYEVECADQRVLDLAISSAKAAFEQWSSMPQIERTRILQKAAMILREKNIELAEIEVLDTGKPISEASVVDVASGADCIEFFANVASALEGSQQTVGKDFYYTRREPLGICAGIGAWNYPLQIACWKAGPALAAGNVMIFKPSEETPLGAIKLAEIFTEAGIPAGVFNVIQGDGKVGAYLSGHADIAKVSFTGEVGTGKKVMANASHSLKEVTMELGGKSPLIIFDDADLENAISATMLGNFYTQGEICTNGTRVFVQSGIYEQFVKRLLERTEKNIIVGNPMNPLTNFGALISKEHQNKVLDFIEKGKEEGAKLLTGGKVLKPDDSPNGFFVSPSIFENCEDHMTIVQEEIFGPVITLLKFDQEQHVIERANNTPYGLAAGVFTQDINRAHRVIHQLEAGICWINSYGLSPVEMPVGGYKESGIGRENGFETLKSYTQVKSIYVGLEKLESPF
jgi:betaine-aldehyde dehydrogenase